MNAVWMAATAPPMPTFSPSWVQLLGAWLVRLGLWEMVPADAIWADQFRAIVVSWACGVSVWIPRDERSWLVRSRNWFSSATVSAWAAGAIAADSPVMTLRAATQAANTRSNLILTCGGSDDHDLALKGGRTNGPPVLVPPQAV